ncbi:MAG: adenylate kinase [Candidatus Methanomethyliaceae archaeon]|nr:adenylate kinase [Candidatus Methanomethyliaceae archaeon]MDW7970361.1 adenylate kinase [Nitrososphaerota archaeon]
MKRMERRGKLVIVTGIPGVGKTTVLNSAMNYCKEFGIEVKYINYGDLMFEEALSRGLVSNRDEIRKLSIKDQIDLQLNAANKISEIAKDKNVILDTHMFIRTNSGYMAGIPAWIAEILMPNSIVLIEANPEEISKRRRKDANVRIREDDSPEKIYEHQLIGRAGAASLAILTGCTVLILENKEGAYDELGRIIALLFKG